MPLHSGKYLGAKGGSFGYAGHMLNLSNVMSRWEGSGGTCIWFLCNPSQVSVFLNSLPRLPHLGVCHALDRGTMWGAGMRQRGVRSTYQGPCTQQSSVECGEPNKSANRALVCFSPSVSLSTSPFPSSSCPSLLSPPIYFLPWPALLSLSVIHLCLNKVPAEVLLGLLKERNIKLATSLCLPLPAGPLRVPSSSILSTGTFSRGGDGCGLCPNHGEPSSRAHVCRCWL